MVIIKENCRLCQKDVGTIPLRDDIIKIIFEIARIKVNKSALVPLPNSICRQCNNRIVESKLFITEIKNVNKYLKNSLKKNSDSVIKIVENNEEQKNIFLNDKTEPLVCPICSKSFIRFSSLEKHQKTHSELYCINCNTFLKSPADASSHKCEKINKNEKWTRLQDESERKNELGDAGVLQIDSVDQFQCIKCKQNFGDENNYKNHLKGHNRFTCSEGNCAKVYTTAYSLKMHKLTHEGKRSFLCVSCGKDFISKKSLICHEKIHAPIKAHRCDSCNVSFSVRSNLRAHIKRYHEGLRYHCSQCPREFLTKCNLDRHEKIHVGVREFKCKHCTSAFYTKKELMKHQRYHQGLKQHKCEQCFKTFFERHHLIVHLRSHSGERPYVCEIPDCGKSFYDSQKLKRHQKAIHISK